MVFGQARHWPPLAQINSRLADTMLLPTPVLMEMFVSWVWWGSVAEKKVLHGSSGEENICEKGFGGQKMSDSGKCSTST